MTRGEDFPRPGGAKRAACERAFHPWRMLDGPAKLRIMSELCRAEHRRMLANLAARHPEADREELELRVACFRVGPGLVERWTGVVLRW